jgi:hypothetical protein
LLSFRVHQFQLSGRHYLLLPKLNSAQIQRLSRRFADEGYAVRQGPILSAKLKGRTIHVDPAGLCWSTVDPADAVLPVIPELLRTPKETVPLRTLEAIYFRIGYGERPMVVRLATRMESSPLWKDLRSSGECGLAPDEGAVVSFITSKTPGTCSMLTDFAVEGSTPRICGRKQYFESDLDGRQVEETLRSAGDPGRRNSYVQQHGVLRLSGLLHLFRDDLRSLFRGLGEWCFFTPE